MIMKDKRMSTEEHLQTADDLAIALHHLGLVFHRCQEHFPKTSRLMRLLQKVAPGFLNGIFTQIKSELDSDYHRTITDEEFKRLGHIYYNLEARFKSITEKGGAV